MQDSRISDILAGFSEVLILHGYGPTKVDSSISSPLYGTKSGSPTLKISIDAVDMNLFYDHRKDSLSAAV